MTGGTNIIITNNHHCLGFILTTRLASAPVFLCAMLNFSPTAQLRAGITTRARAARPPNQSLCDTHTQTRAASEVAGGMYSHLRHSKRLSCAHNSLNFFILTKINIKLTFRHLHAPVTALIPCV